VQSPQFPDAGGVFLTGRIDRVDHHATSGRYRALDYKTSSSADTPTDTHMKISGGKKARKVEWLDLQLPLYRVLLRSLPAPVDVAPTDLGYINLGPNFEKSGFSFLEASEEDLEKAQELARSIVGEIRAGNFKPSERMPLWANDPLGPIWGVGMRPSSAPAVAGAANEGGAA
jgi:ATP-dependent helicase/nuclease subunit B